MPNAIVDSQTLNDIIDTQLDAAGFDVDNDPYISALVTPVKEAIEVVNNQIKNYYNRSILEHASDDDLDEKVSEFGLKRGNIGIAFDDTYDNFNVLLQNGKAEDYALDTNSPLVIPPNAITINDINNNSYSITDSIVINPNSFSGYAPIIAHTALEGGVAVGAINSCTVNLSLVQNLNPAKTEEVSFGCNNTKVILTPDAASTDDELKNSAFLRINSMNNTNTDAITFALNNYGIYDITYKRNMFGFGTLGVIVKVGDSPRISNTTIKNINAILSNIAPFARAVEPEQMVVKFSIRITFVDDEPDLITTAKEDVSLALQDYFDRLDLGVSIDPSSIKEELISVENVDKLDIICMFIDDRPCIKTVQEAMGDQIFILDADEPIIYVS